jgi:hypothetical protein
VKLAPTIRLHPGDGVAIARATPVLGASFVVKLWVAAPPIYFCGILFDLIDDGGGRGVVR